MMITQDKPTLDDLDRVCDECVQREGRGHAVKVLKAATGTMFTWDVPEDKIVAGIAALKDVRSPVGMPRSMFTGKTEETKRPQTKREALNGIAASIYRTPACPTLSIRSQ